MNNNHKNALLFVQISTHFREIIRVARLMKKRGSYSPKVFFVAPYEGWKNDFQQCQLEEIDCICYFNQSIQNSIPNKKNIFVRLLLFLFSSSKIKNNKIKSLINLVKRNIASKQKKIKTISYIFYKINRIRIGFGKALIPSLTFYRKYFKSIRLTHTILTSLIIYCRYVLGTIKSILRNICGAIEKIFRVIFILTRPLRTKSYVILKRISRTIIQKCIYVIPPKILSYLLLSFYKFIWNKKTQFLPPISKAAYYFYNYLPFLLLENHIRLIVLPEHNLFYFTQLLVYQGRKYQMPAIIVPFTIANTIEWSEAFYGEPSRSLDSILNKICARAFPHWVNHYKNRNLLLPVELVLLHEMFGITPKNTWLLNSGDIDFLASESEAMKSYYVSAGIEEKHLRVTGALYNDELFSRLQNAEFYRSELYEKLNMKPDKPLILCALPPNQCFGRMHLIEFNSYEEIVRFMLAELSQYEKDYNIIVNLHPRIVFETVSYISDYPVKIYSGNIAEIIPLSSIFVASCSATIRMAISSGIPVVNYDLYHYDYDDYQNLNGVLTMKNKLEFSSVMNKLITNTDFFEKIKTAQLMDSQKWGTLDGKSGQNLLSEIDLLFA